MTNEGINAADLDTIFTQALLFLIVFAILSIISMIISKKNAKKYELENPLQDRKDKARKDNLVERYINNSLVRIKGKDFILLKLSKLLKKKIINEEEFQILKLSLDEI